MQTISRNLSRYRNELKGVAILWVVLFHAQLGLEDFLYQVQRIGYGGVDLFFFLSGYGLYYSLEKDADLGRYLKRRGERLLPAYLPFCLVWLAVMLPMHGGGLATSLRIAAGNLTMTGYFANVDLNINWYVSAMALSLLLAPVFHAVLNEEKHFWLRSAGLMAVLFVIGFAYIGNDQYMAVSRLPVFALGMIFAAPQSKNLSGKKSAAAMAVAGALGLAALYVCLENYAELLVAYAVYWHPFVLITPGLCAGLAWVFAKLPRVIGKPFALLGKASFEIFLFNVWIEVLGKKYGLASSPAEWLMWSIGGIAAGCAYHWLISEVLHRRNQKISKRG